MMKLYYEYASKVLNNEIVTGDTIKLACKRFQNDLLRDDLEFREDVVDRAISFIGTLKQASTLAVTSYWKAGSSLL